MSEFCPVAPARILHALKCVDTRLVRYNLLLAHDVVTNPQEYRSVFDNFVHFSIMDNSIVELGDAVSAEMVAEASHIVNANVYVLPDVYGKGPETVEMVLSNVDRWNSVVQKAQPEAVPCVVVHGRNQLEWLRCLVEITRRAYFPWIAIPRIVTLWEPNRAVLVDYVRAYAPQSLIHLLGFGDHAIYDIAAARHPGVSSIDSAAPLRMPSPLDITADPGKRGNWWTECEFNMGMADNVRQMQKLLHPELDYPIDHSI